VGEVEQFQNLRRECEAALDNARAYLDEHGAHGCIVIVCGEVPTPFYNDSMGADGAVAVLEAVKLMNAQVLIGGEEE